MSKVECEGKYYGKKRYYTNELSVAAHTTIKRECESLQALIHPFVQPINEIYHTHRIIYVMSEWADSTLFDVIKTRN